MRWNSKDILIQLSDGAFHPTRASQQATGYDLSVPAGMSGSIAPGEHVLIDTKIKLKFSDNYDVSVRSRSGLASKHQVIVLNSPGTIDPDYRGNIKVILKNLGNLPFEFKGGDRIAQLVFTLAIHPKFAVVREIEEDSVRADGGFGSTGLNSQDTPPPVRPLSKKGWL